MIDRFHNPLCSLSIQRGHFTKKRGSPLVLDPTPIVKKRLLPFLVSLVQGIQKAFKITDQSIY